MGLKTNLDYLIENKGLTYKKVAESIGVSEGTIHSIKAGEGSLKNLTSVANFLGVPIADLFKENEVKFASGWGSKIKHYRKIRDFTQEEFADQLGVSKNTIVKWESESEAPTLAQSEKIADTLNIHWWLIFSEKLQKNMALLDLINESANEAKQLVDEHNELVKNCDELRRELAVAQVKIEQLEKSSNLYEWEANLIYYLRSLPEKVKLPKLFALTGDSFYLEAYQKLVDNSRASSLETSDSAHSPRNGNR